MDHKESVRNGSGVDEVVRRYASQDLFGSGKEIEIIHGPHLYRLRMTRQNKLILNK